MYYYTIFVCVYICSSSFRSEEFIYIGIYMKTGSLVSHSIHLLAESDERKAKDDDDGKGKMSVVCILVCVL